MQFRLTNIDDFFHTNLLRLSIVGTVSILISNLTDYPESKLFIALDCVILFCCLVAYSIREKYKLLSKLILITFVTLVAYFQFLMVPNSASASISLLLVIGFVVSILLKGKTMWFYHISIFIALNIAIVLRYNNSNFSTSKGEEGILNTACIYYSILYFILTFAATMLKSGYDKIVDDLNLANRELQEKTNEIEAQNEELLQMQESLGRYNETLEKTVNERTQMLEEKTEKIIRYSYVNAHHLRGPVARLLGLVAIHKLEQSPDHNFFFEKVKEQADEIDFIVKQINTDLEGI